MAAVLLEGKRKAVSQRESGDGGRIEDVRSQYCSQSHG